MQVFQLSAFNTIPGLAINKCGCLTAQRVCLLDAAFWTLSLLLEVYMLCLCLCVVCLRLLTSFISNTMQAMSTSWERPTPWLFSVFDGFEVNILASHLSVSFGRTHTKHSHTNVIDSEDIRLEYVLVHLANACAIDHILCSDSCLLPMIAFELNSSL